MNEGLEHMDDLIAKVLAGEASREEIDRLEDWLNNSDQNRNYFEETKKLFSQVEKAKEVHKVDSLKAWEKLNARITAEEQEARVVPLYRRPVLRIAASIILIAVLALLVNYIFNNQQPVPVVLAAQQKVVEQKLPDGSTVTLNKNSEIAYVVNDKHVREIKLKGEAYFEVVHNEEQPFEIVVDEVIIQDIGTAFNVKATPGSNLVEVWVESGEVRFFTSTSQGLTLTKGEKASYDRTSKVFTKIVPVPEENTASYKSKVFFFKETALSEVITQLNAIYDSNIQLGDERLGKCLISTSFDNRSLEDVIDIIAETLDLEVERSGDKIVLKGQPCNE